MEALTHGPYCSASALTNLRKQGVIAQPALATGVSQQYRLYCDRTMAIKQLSDPSNHHTRDRLRWLVEVLGYRHMADKARENLVWESSTQSTMDLLGLLKHTLNIEGKVLSTHFE